MYYLFIMRQVIYLFTLEKNPRFTAFLDSNFHTLLAIVTKNELGLAFPPRNLPKKFRPDPSTFYLVIVVTNKQTDRQTNAGKNIVPRFRGDNKKIAYKIFGVMSKDLYSEISAQFGIDSVENLVANRRNRFINRHGETDNYLCQLLR